MRRIISGLVLSVVGAFSASVEAAELSGRVTAAVKADTKANSEIQIAPQVVIGAENDVKVLLTPSLALKSSAGVASMPILGGDTTNAEWGGGISVIFGSAAEKRPVGSLVADAMEGLTVVRKAMEFCSKIEPDSGDPKNIPYFSFIRSNSSRAAGAPPLVPGVNDVCVEAVDRLKSTYTQRYPGIQLDFAATTKRSAFKYRTLTDDVLAAESEESLADSSWALGATRVWPSANQPFYWTTELFVTSSSTWTASSSTVRVCEPITSVADSASATAESCSEGVLGPPTNADEFAGTLLVGGAPIGNDLFRVSGGVDLRGYRTGDADWGARVELVFPVYVRVLQGGLFKKGSSEGLVRVVPRATLPVGTASDVVASVEVAFLGDRSMFGDPLRWK